MTNGGRVHRNDNANVGEKVKKQMNVREKDFVMMEEFLGSNWE